MPPTTRLSGGGLGPSHSPSNLDHILENFNQFKRKHITQNRDIIKTNALAQLRIKELEEKVLQLEGERAERSLELIRMRANMDRAERATRSVVRGWQMVGAGLAAMAAIDGFQVAEAVKLGNTQAYDMHHKEAAFVKASSRIVLDPQALPGGVTRSVARAPEVQLGEVLEEDSRELRAEEMEEGIETVEVDDTEMAEEGESNNVSFQDEETVRMDHRLSAYHEQERWTTAYAGEGGERQASSSSALLPSARDVAPMEHQDAGLRRAASIDSLSSFADDEEIQLSDDVDEEGQEDLLQTILQESKRMAEEEEGESFQARSRKKRGLPVSAESYDERRSSTPSRLNGNHSSSENDSPHVVRSSRRSSARNGKSINYALPKLNTKMRKPDPADLIPAKEGEARGHGGGDGGSADDSSREVTPKRTLKGKNEAASTGNLREIRKQHASAHKGAEEEQGSTMVNQDHPSAGASMSSNRQGPTTRRRSSTGPQPRKSQLGDGTSSDREDRDRGNQSDGEMTPDLSSSSWSTSTPLPARWKGSSVLASSSSSSSSSSSLKAAAANGTPIPRGNSGQHIKALKVANRIQKAHVTQPVFPADGNKRSNARPTSAGGMSVNAKVLASSGKMNLQKAMPMSGGEGKRSSLHAAMTLDEEDQRGTSAYAMER